VISRQTALSYQGRPIDIAAIGAELGVRYVLEGNMRMGDDKLRVNVALIDPASRLPVWSSHIERDGAERHAVQDEIVRRIGRELLLEVDQAEAETGSKEPGVDELVHRGWVAIFAAGTSGLDGLKQAEAYFTQALERDPQNERAQTGLASYHVNLSVQGYVANTVPDLAKAEDLVRQVIDRHPNAGDAHYYMAVIHRMRGNLEDAIGSLERSLDSNPSNASAHAQLGFVLSLMGREAEGLEYITTPCV
jgi:tetratricopeptide (TPR) repeat protein